MTMPGDVTFGSGDSWFGQALIDAVNDGTVEEDRVTVRGAPVSFAVI